MISKILLIFTIIITSTFGLYFYYDSLEQLFGDILLNISLIISVFLLHSINDYYNEKYSIK